MVICPSSSVSFPMDIASVLPLLDCAGFCAGVELELPPMEEKFHFPLGSFSMVTCGFTIEISVTLSCLEKISGIRSTPTLTFFAGRNGPELNFGSSLTDKSSIPTEPPRMERLKLPSETLRPSACEALASMVGRNLFTGIRKGRTSKITIKTTTTIAIHFNAFMKASGRQGVGGRPTRVRLDNITLPEG